MLNIKKSQENGAATLALEGRLDTVTAPVLEEQIKQLLPELQTLILDFTALEYISSAGLRVLLAAQKQMQRRGEMRVVHVNETVMEIFDVTGFSDILTIETD